MEQVNRHRADDQHAVVEQYDYTDDIETAILMGTYSIRGSPSAHHEVPPTAA
jgi:hypothetical protein